MLFPFLMFKSVSMLFLQNNCANKLLLLRSKEPRGLLPHLKTIKEELLGTRIDIEE